MVIDAENKSSANYVQNRVAKLKLKAFKSCIYHFHYKWSVLAEPMKHRPMKPEHLPIITDLWHCKAIDNH